MHYIVGTRFSITPPKTVPGRITLPRVRKETRLPIGQSYILTYIRKHEDNFEYQFKGTDGQLYTVRFTSCRDADEFMAKYRNEVLPEQSQQVTEN